MLSATRECPACSIGVARTGVPMVSMIVKSGMHIRKMKNTIVSSSAP